MGELVCFAVGLLTRTWIGCLVIAALVGLGDVLIFGIPGAKADDAVYNMGYVSAYYLFDVAVAIVGHALRGLALRLAGRRET